MSIVVDVISFQVQLITHICRLMSFILSMLNEVALRKLCLDLFLKKKKIKVTVFLKFIFFCF